jgi:hypothetical protein
MKTSPAQNGVISKSISVQTDSPEMRTIRLRFTVDVDAPIIAKPRLRFVLTLVEGFSASRTMLLHRTDGEPLEILSAEIDAQGLLVKTESVKKAVRKDRIDAVPGDVWIELTNDPKIDTWTRQGSIRLETNHPELRQLDVPYALRVRPLIEARPPQVNFWLSGGTAEGRSAILSLAQNGKEDFAITDVKVSHPELFWATSASEKPATRQNLRVGLVDGLETGSIKGSIEGFVQVHTTDPNRPTVTVPVLIAPKRSLTRRRVRTQPPPTPVTSGANGAAIH